MDENFQQRLGRLGTQQPAQPRGPQRRQPPSFNWKRLAIGFICSLIVGVLFFNIQTISDSAPQFIKDSAKPGLFGAPVALLTAGWIVIIPLMFMRAVIGGALTGWRVKPSPFVIGAGIGIALVFLIIQFVNGPA